MEKYYNNLPQILQYNEIWYNQHIYDFSTTSIFRSWHIDSAADPRLMGQGSDDDNEMMSW